jgi:hypothetical protein
MPRLKSFKKIWTAGAKRRVERKALFPPLDSKQIRPYVREPERAAVPPSVIAEAAGLIAILLGAER